MENKQQWKVYKHTTPSNKIYIGITSEEDINKRWKNGYGYKKQLFYIAIKKYGWNNIKHEILYTNLTREQAENKEQELIALYKSNNPKYGYNQTNGGNTPTIRTQEIKEKISKNLKDFYKTPKGQAFKEKLSKETAKRTGNKNPFYNKKHSEATKKKMSQIHKKMTGEKAPRSIPIIMKDKNNNIIKEFINKKEALEFLNIVCYQSLNKALKNHTIYKNYYWGYKNE